PARRSRDPAPPPLCHTPLLLSHAVHGGAGDAVHPPVSMAPTAVDLPCTTRTADMLVGRGGFGTAGVHRDRIERARRRSSDRRIYVAGGTGGDRIGPRPGDVPDWITRRGLNAGPGRISLPRL